MRKTKIVCTLGPSTDKEGVLREMIQAGMNVARFNFSHGTHAEHKARLDTLKALREELDAPVAAMLDTKGPEIRLKDFANGSVCLTAGQEFTLTTAEAEGDVRGPCWRRRCWPNTGSCRKARRRRWPSRWGNA